MLAPGSDHVCDGCAFVSDHVDAARQHFEHADLSFVAVSRAPIAQIQAVKARMGWTFDWVSSYGSDFNYDFGVSFTDEQIAAGKPLYNFGTSPYLHPDLPGSSVFAKDGTGRIFRTYSTYTRGLGAARRGLQLARPGAEGPQRGWRRHELGPSPRRIRGPNGGQVPIVAAERRPILHPSKQKGTHDDQAEDHPCLWFDGQAEEAANVYISIFRNSKITAISRYGDAGPVPRATSWSWASNSTGKRSPASTGARVQVQRGDLDGRRDAEEVDHYWDRLLDGGEPSQCGWLKDRFGISWQIVPTALLEMVQDEDPARSQRVMAAMLKMRKLDIAGSKQAYGA